MPPTPTPSKRAATQPAPAKRIVRRPVVPGGLVSDNGDDGDDDQPVQSAPKMRQAAAQRSKIKGGWGESQKQMDSTSTFAQTYRPDEKTQIIKFLEDVPYAAFRRHWIERTTPEGKVNRPWTCLLSFDDPCPLCEIGDRPQAVSCFNIAICDENGSVTRKSWDVGARLYNVLQAYARDPKIAPLTKGFFLVSRTGKKGSTQYNVVPVKATALEEDYDTPVPSTEALQALDLYTVDIVEVPTAKTLRDLAAELVDDYE